MSLRRRTARRRTARRWTARRWTARRWTARCALVAALAGPAHAAPDAGVDAVVYRPSFDAEGMWSIESDRTLDALDLSWKSEVGFRLNPLTVAVPGIGAGQGEDDVLSYVFTFHQLVAFGLTSRLTLAIDAAVYRTEAAAGYGERGRYRAGQEPASTGLISLRELSNIDPSGGFEPQGLSGPLDARVAAKFRLLGGTSSRFGAALLAAARLPFGNEEMFLGDEGVVLEPKLSAGWHGDELAIVANVGVLLRDRVVLEAYDQPGGEMRSDARAVLDVGSELSAAIGARLALLPRMAVTGEVSVLNPLPESVSLGDCERVDGEPCRSLSRSDYFAGQRYGDRVLASLAGLDYQVHENLVLRFAGGAGLTGARSERFHVAAGLTWRPDSSTGARPAADQDRDRLADRIDSCPGRPEDGDAYQDEDGCPELDNDVDGVRDIDDRCPLEPEDRDGYRDGDGCPESDNDRDGVVDVIDACPAQREDDDGFGDDDGCPDEDDDGDRLADKSDRCPHEAETPNGYADEDGCPDAREVGGPTLAQDRIDLSGSRIEFKGARSVELSAASKALLGQIGQLLKRQPVQIRVEVHVPRSARSGRKAEQARAARRDRRLSERRARELLRFLVEREGVPLADLQAVGLGSARPRSDLSPDDPAQARVDFILIRQGRP
jgi:large repetitive protein